MFYREDIIKTRTGDRRSGQATVEYAVIAGLLVASLAIFVFFLGAFQAYGNRILNIIGSGYP